MKAAKYVSALIIVLYCLAMGLIETCEARETNPNLPVVVSMGDSYSSGEGIENFYDYNIPMSQRQYSQDWLAHRSMYSWPGQLRIPGMPNPLSYYKGSQWFFVASSGAVTNNLYYGQHKEFNREGYTFSDDTGWIDPQQDILIQLKQQGIQVDYVTLTLGGNDADFAKAVATAVLDTKVTRGTILNTKLIMIWQHFWESGGIRDQLFQAYSKIAELTDNKAHIIVAGYPKLFCTDLYSAISPSFFSLTERLLVNKNVHDFNEQIRKLVEECRDKHGMDIEFVSVEEAFEGHGAYASVDKQYINPVWGKARDQDIDEKAKVSDYSMHPNARGAEAYAACIQPAIDRHYASTHGDDLFRVFLESTLIPKYGILSSEVLYGSESRTNAELSGILNADICDYDGDGALEMLVSRFTVAPASEIGTGRYDELMLILEMYEIRGGSVSLQSAMPLILHGVTEIQGKFGSTASCFRFKDNGRVTIALDTFFGIEEATTTLTTYRYDGDRLHFHGGVGNQSYGSGRMLARQAIVLWQNYLCTTTCSEWWGQLVGHRSGWSTVEEWDSEAHNWEMPTRQDTLHFFTLYREAAFRMGVNVAGDYRVLPAEADDSDGGIYGANQYNLRFTQSLEDIYAGTEDLQPMWRIASYRPLGGALELHREDIAGSLDAWR